MDVYDADRYDCGYEQRQKHTSVSACLTLFTSYSGNVAIFRTKVYYPGRCTLHHNTAPKKDTSFDRNIIQPLLMAVVLWLS